MPPCPPTPESAKSALLPVEPRDIGGSESCRKPVSVQSPFRKHSRVAPREIQHSEPSAVLPLFLHQSSDFSTHPAELGERAPESKVMGIMCVELRTCAYQALVTVVRSMLLFLQVSLRLENTGNDISPLHPPPPPPPPPPLPIVVYPDTKVPQTDSVGKFNSLTHSLTHSRNTDHLNLHS